MKIDPALIQASAAFLAALAALAGALYAVITRPLLAYMSDMRGDIKVVRDELMQFKTEARGDFKDIRTELSGIRKEIAAQGERLARVEERLPPPLVHH